MNLRISREKALETWVASLVAAAIGVCAGLAALGYRVERPEIVVALAVLTLVAVHERVRLTPTIEVTISSLVCVFAAVALGPLSGAVVAAIGLLRDLPRRDAPRPILRWATWTSIRVLATAGAGVAAAAVRGGSGDGFLVLFGAIGAAFLVETAIDLTLSCVAPAIRGSSTVLATLQAGSSTHLVSVPVHVPTVAVLVYAFDTISPWSLALFAVPAMAAQRLLLLYHRQRETAEALGEANARLSKANLSFATALVATLDARDRYTAGHSTAVAIYARDIAKRMGLAEEEQERVHLCGLVHDIGKIGLAAGLLEKPGALTLEERREMERHSVIGEEILRNVEDYDDIAAIVRHHHERFDGTGYPDQVAGSSIPLLARIIAVADAYNAMTSDRPYRDAMPSRVARLRLAQAVESQFDTAVVAAFEAILAGAAEEYRLAQGAEFNLRWVEESDVSTPLEPAAAAPGALVLPL
jgi:putative nucleotidyltransferase with HDIG domain